MASEAAQRLVEHLVEEAPAAGGAEPGARASRGTYEEEIRALTDPTEQRTRIEERLVELCAAVARLDVAQVDPKLPLPALGFDSILTAEIRGQIRAHFGVEIPLTGMLLGANLTRVAALVQAALEGTEAGATGEPRTKAAVIANAMEVPAPAR